jgi:1,4-dihydroxy-2-naphthoate octaprenyltransferase
MESKKLQDLSTEELQKKEKTTKFLTGMLGGVLSMLFCLNIYTGITKGFSSLTAVPFALLPILILNIKNLKDIKKELDVRSGK